MKFGTKLNQKLGFSLIELSIAILVIGILVIGVTKGSRIIYSAKIKSARALTDGSPVNSTSNLILWLETTSDKSFDTTVGIGDQITTWNDINTQSTTKNNATQTVSSSYSPIYTSNLINGLPALEFDGTDDYLSFSGADLIGTNYTAFIVEKRTDGNNNYFIGGTGSKTNGTLVFGYNSNKMIFNQYKNSYVTGAIFPYSSPTPRIHCFRFHQAIGRNYHLNGTNITITPSGSVSPTQGLVSYDDAMIAKWATLDYYKGDIAEIIMFNRYLRDGERQEIEDYLSQKWGINLS